MNMNSIQKFLEVHPDMKFIVEMYVIGSAEQFGEDCRFEIATNQKEEANFATQYQEKGFKLVDANHFGSMRGDVSACMMVFKKKR